MTASCGLEPPVSSVDNEQPLPRNRPLVIYDGDCGFCVKWATRWLRLGGDRIDVISFQALGNRLPEIDREACAKAVHLLEPQPDAHRVSRASEAALRAHCHAVGRDPDRGTLGATMPLITRLLDPPYALVAKHRDIFNRLSPLMYGKLAVPETHQFSRELFIRLMAFVYLIAFLTFGHQASGLIGSTGILPVAEFLPLVSEKLGPNAWLQMPTVLWISSSDAAIHATWIAGSIAALLAVLGVVPMLAMITCWALYLSLVYGGQAFLSFQWDMLLLEAGFLAILYAPSSPTKWNARPSWLARLLVTWLLFRLMFESGLVKLLSGDATWTDGTALGHHWFTQPLPTTIAWWMHQLPDWCNTIMTWGMFAIELALPFLLFLPRTPRTIAAAGIALLMMLITATGNYGFFNLLVIVLCLATLDDAVLRSVPPFRKRRKPGPKHWALPATAGRSQKLATTIFAIIIIPGSILIGWSDAIRTSENATFRSIADDPEAVREFIEEQNTRGESIPVRMAQWWQPAQAYGLVQSYGLFRVMTTSRPELTIEASSDRKEWLPYLFKYKPGPLDRAPSRPFLYMPRLDWQMWFAALSAQQGQASFWLQPFLTRLFEADPAVLGLLEEAPFGSDPPAWIRVRMSEYTFTLMNDDEKTGDWWRSENSRLFIPPVSDP